MFRNCFDSWSVISKRALEYVGIGIACASWVFVLYAVVWIITWNIGVIGEEHICLKMYGDIYRKYINRTPRWIGIPNSEK